MDIIYSEEKIEHVMDWFIKNFAFVDGKKLSNSDWFYDTKKGIVVFKLYVKD